MALEKNGKFLKTNIEYLSMSKKISYKRRNSTFMLLRVITRLRVGCYWNSFLLEIATVFKNETYHQLGWNKMAEYISIHGAKEINLALIITLYD